jgi:hypothetical protein
MLGALSSWSADSQQKSAKVQSSFDLIRVTVSVVSIQNSAEGIVYQHSVVSSLTLDYQQVSASQGICGSEKASNIDRSVAFAWTSAQIFTRWALCGSIAFHRASIFWHGKMLAVDRDRQNIICI